jgi:hypothetical protein
MSRKQGTPVGMRPAAIAAGHRRPGSHASILVVEVAA